METNLTKKMKKNVVFFKPAMPTKMRTIRYATEVWTPSGIVDAIRFEDYKETEENICALINYKEFENDYQKLLLTVDKEHLGKCKIDGCSFPNNNCNGCVWKKHSYKTGMLITCYECKISLSDFKSKNGHNFHGNYNFYVVPKELVNKIADLVPNEIGIIAYYEKSNRFKLIKAATFQSVSNETKILLLYNSLKKWVDKGGIL